MAMTVITVSRVSPSLRGDLTKWMQEIATGVYIGNFNSKVREELWSRVKQNVGKGEATLAYRTRDEIGYDFETYQTKRYKIDIEGVSLIFVPKDDSNSANTTDGKGYSLASKSNQARKHIKNKNVGIERPIVILDIETSGLDPLESEIIEIGAIKINGGKVEEFAHLLKIEKPLPKKITELTGITNTMLNEEGKDPQGIVSSLIKFLGDIPIVGYNLHFDISFLNRYLVDYNFPKISNKQYDLYQFIKKDNMFLKSYTLKNVLLEYKIDSEVSHRALKDSYKIYELLIKVNKFVELINKDR